LAGSWELAQLAPKDSDFQAPLFMVDDQTLSEGSVKLSPDEQLFDKEFEEMQRMDLTWLVRNGRKSRSFEFAIFQDPFVKEDFESLFAGAWRTVEGEGMGFIGEDWKETAEMK
jgi:hypothetical protein